MELSHVTAHTAISSADIFQQLKRDVNTITKQTRNNAFADLECQLHQAFVEAERHCMQKLLEQYDYDYPAFISDSVTYRRASRNKRRYMTLAGEVSVERTLYRTERNGPTYSPLELNSGIIEGFWTPQAAK